MNFTSASLPGCEPNISRRSQRAQSRSWDLSEFWRRHRPTDLTIPQARTLLVRIKQANVPKFTFIPDDHDISRLPAWVKTPRQITDGHLVNLASAVGGTLATLDGKIPGGYLIPDR